MGAGGVNETSRGRHTMKSFRGKSAGGVRQTRLFRHYCVRPVSLQAGVRAVADTTTRDYRQQRGCGRRRWQKNAEVLAETGAVLPSHLLHHLGGEVVLRRGSRKRSVGSSSRRWRTTANPRTRNLDFRGFGSSRLLFRIVFPKNIDSGFLVLSCGFLVCGLAVGVLRRRVSTARPQGPGSSFASARRAADCQLELPWRCSPLVRPDRFNQGGVLEVAMTRTAPAPGSRHDHLGPSFLLRVWVAPAPLLLQAVAPTPGKI